MISLPLITHVQTLFLSTFTILYAIRPMSLRGKVRSLTFDYAFAVLRHSVCYRSRVMRPFEVERVRHEMNLEVSMFDERRSTTRRTLTYLLTAFLTTLYGHTFAICSVVVDAPTPNSQLWRRQHGLQTPKLQNGAYFCFGQRPDAALTGPSRLKKAPLRHIQQDTGLILLSKDTHCVDPSTCPCIEDLLSKALNNVYSFRPDDLDDHIEGRWSFKQLVHEWKRASYERKNDGGSFPDIRPKTELLTSTGCFIECVLHCTCYKCNAGTAVQIQCKPFDFGSGSDNVSITSR